MSYTVELKLKTETYQQFKNIHTKLNNNDREPQSKYLGDNISNIACELIDQAFGSLVNQSSSKDGDSEKVLKQVKDAITKYMPWSVSFFGNDRLLPMVNHVNGLMKRKNDQGYITYPVDKVVVEELLGCAEQLKQGNTAYVKPGLKAFTQVVDQGVTSLIREPKKLLKFNMVVNKTLDGVISLTTQLGYKRFDKLSSIYDAQTIGKYFDHFVAFLDKGDNNKAS